MIPNSCKNKLLEYFKLNERDINAKKYYYNNIS